MPSTAHLIVAIMTVWILWAQSHTLQSINDQLMVEPSRNEQWRYIDGFDTKGECTARRKALIAAQQAEVEALDTNADLRQAKYREYKCFPITISPMMLTIGVDE